MQHMQRADSATMGAPHESGNRTHCQRLKDHLTKRNIYFEEKTIGNTTIIEIKKDRPADNTSYR